VVNLDVRQRFKMLSVLFVLAVTAFEIFTKFSHESPWLLGIYLATLVAIGSEP